MNQRLLEREGDISLLFGWLSCVASAFCAYTWARELMYGQTTFLDSLPTFTPLVACVLLSFAAVFLGFHAVAHRRMKAGLLLAFGAVALPLFSAVWLIAQPIVEELQR